MRTRIVLGAGFGDEGKGSVVNNLCKKSMPDLIVRFNGGHQVGHTVVEGDVSHVFSNFGSGTLQGVPTYWSEYCTVHPKALLNEASVLANKGITPILYIDPLCPIVTPFDIKANQEREGCFRHGVRHGSVGVGFGTTIARQEAFYKLYAQDLLTPTVAKLKFRAIAKWYGHLDIEALEKEFFEEAFEMLTLLPQIHILRPPLEKYKNVIFEGGQGILLDQDFGFFPHVTRSNTTSKNAIELLKQFDCDTNPEVIYVTRTYLTRHGAGPLPFEEMGAEISLPNPKETNVSHQWQGEFRYAPLNLDLLEYVISSDAIFHKLYDQSLWITCADQTPEWFTAINHERPIKIVAGQISKNVLNIRTRKIQWEP